MEKIKVAIIGCGTIANSAHIPAYMKNEKAEIKYFCDIIPERADAAVEKYGVGKAVYDYKEVLADPEIEAVSICTPNYMHSVIAVDALEAGKNVLCEKPAARILSEAQRMLDAAERTGKILNIGVCNRFHDSVTRIKEYIDEGRLGEVYHVYASFRAHRSIPGLGGAFTTKAIAGGGALIDWGVHFIDLILYCVGDPKPLTVSGTAFSKLGVDMENYTYESMWAGPPDYNGTYDVDDSVVGIVRTEGPVVSLNGAWAQNIGKSEMFIDFMGTKAGVRLEYGGHFTLYTAEHGALVEYTPKFEIKNMYEKEIDSFLDCVKTQERNRADIRKIIHSSEIMQALYDSSDLGREVVVE
ncbi:MAG: Gfo/Idh/MocA family oxidoreductase [Ruminococcaceae bacterium]|nr:Gfo/Idh/MocA family oxidoreductase [Oscillospiraceae bacterium]